MQARQDIQASAISYIPRLFLSFLTHHSLKIQLGKFSEYVVLLYEILVAEVLFLAGLSNKWP